MASAPSPALLRKLKVAAIASGPFAQACKRALDLPKINFNETQSESQSLSLSFSQPEEQPLTEDELRAWREATESLLKLLPDNNIYFISYTLLDVSNKDTLLLAQINAANLGLTLEMFLPASTRDKYPLLTIKIPFIDGSSMSSQQSSQSSEFSQLTEEQRLEKLTLPLAELKTVYLRLCAGRKEKHITYVLKKIILEICCVSIITSTKARGLKSFKPQDLVDTFRVGFLRDPTLVGPGHTGGVFETKEMQEKACKTWEKWSGMVIKGFQNSSTNPLTTAQTTYTWDKLADALLTDIFRHVLPPVLATLSAEEKQNAAGIAARGKEVEAETTQATAAKIITPKNTGATLGQPADSIDARFFIAKKRIPIEVPQLPSSASSTSVANPSVTMKATTEMIAQAKATAPHRPQPTTARASVSNAAGNNSLAPANPKASDLAPANVDEDEFGPRIINAANRGPTVLLDKDRAALDERRRRVTQEFDMMDFVQNFGDDVQDFGNDDAGGAYFGNEDVVDTSDIVEDAETQWEERVARFGQAPYIQPPKEGYTRIPKGFVFNAPQANAEKATMTPSPESQRLVYTRAPGRNPGKVSVVDADENDPAKKSTLSRIKAAVGTDRTRGKTASRGASADPTEPIKSKAAARGQKRKQQIDEDDEDDEDEGEGIQPAKRRKVTNDMPPPAVHDLNTTHIPSKPSATGASARASAASTITLVGSQIAKHSSTLPNLAGSSSARGAVRAAPAPPRRPLVMADTDSEDEPVHRRKRTVAPRSPSASPPPAPAPAPATKSKSSTAKAPAASRSTATAKPKATRRPVPLSVSDAIMDGSRQRLSQIKAINEENKRLAAALKGQEENDEDDDATEEEDAGDSDEELRKYREQEALRKTVPRDDEDEDGDEFEKSRRKLADLKKRTTAIDRLPVRRRAKHITAVPLSDGEGDEIQDFDDAEEPVDKPRKRGRPRKVASRSTSPVSQNRVKAPANPYRTGANEHGRKKWTREEDVALLYGLEVAYYQGKELLHPWQFILTMHGPDGTNSDVLAEKNVVQIKDRARNIALRMHNEGQPLPKHLAWIKLPKNKLRR